MRYRLLKLHESGIRSRIYYQNLPQEKEIAHEATSSVQIIYVAPLLIVFVLGVTISSLLLIMEIFLSKRPQNMRLP